MREKYFSLAFGAWQFTVALTAVIVAWIAPLDPILKVIVMLTSGFSAFLWLAMTKYTVSVQE